MFEFKEKILEIIIMKNENSKNINEIPFSKGNIIYRFPFEVEIKFFPEKKIIGISNEPHVFINSEKKPEEIIKQNNLCMTCGISNMPPVEKLSNSTNPFLNPNPNPLFKLNQKKISYNNIDFNFENNQKDKEFPSIFIIFLLL